MSAQKSGRPAADENNQPPPLAGYNVYHADPLLKDIADSLPRALHAEFEATGKFTASAEAQDLARIANRSTPELRTHSPSGQRIDLVEFHPAYHALMELGLGLDMRVKSMIQNVSVCAATTVSVLSIVSQCCIVSSLSQLTTKRLPVRCRTRVAVA